MKIENLNNNSNKFYILAETAFSHEGNVEYLKKQIDEASKGQADGVKIQMLIDIEESYSSNLKNYKEISKWTFKIEEWDEIINYIKENTNLEIIVLPIDNSAMDYCINKQDFMDAIEIHSINFNHCLLLSKLKKFNKTVILGIGGRTIEDICYANSIIQSEKTIYMHGYQSFPTDYTKLKLGYIKKYKEIFNVVMGYADHTSYLDESRIRLIEYAYLNGARIFENHIVVEKGCKRIDYEAAIAMDDLIKIRKSLNQLLEIQGEALDFTLNEEELKYRGREKQIVAISDIEEEEIFGINNIGFKVSEKTGDFQQKEFEKIIGKKANRRLVKDSVLDYYDIKS